VSRLGGSIAVVVREDTVTGLSVQMRNQKLKIASRYA
jgi:hypothetical protein